MRMEDIFGAQTLNCAYFDKLGVCKDQARCKKKHDPPFRPATLLLRAVYPLAPVDYSLANRQEVDPERAEEAMQRYQDFYEDFFKELANYGLIEDMALCENVSQHLKGNLYVRFQTHQEAVKCEKGLSGRSYQSVRLRASLLSGRSFARLKCRDEAEMTCERAGSCNYAHLKPLSTEFKKRLFLEMLREHPEYLSRFKEQQRRLQARKRNRQGDRDRHGNRSRSRSRQHQRQRRRTKKH